MEKQIDVKTSISWDSFLSIAERFTEEIKKWPKNECRKEELEKITKLMKQVERNHEGFY